MITNDPQRFQCRHVFQDGHRCGSPALRKEIFCYYHHTTRKPAQRLQHLRYEFDSHIPDNRTAIQLALGDIIHRVMNRSLDSRRAGLLLYALQIASGNLPRDRDRKPEPVVEDLIEDEVHGILAPEAEYHEAQGEKSVEQLLDEEWAFQKALLEEQEQREREQQEHGAQQRAILALQYPCLAEPTPLAEPGISISASAGVIVATTASTVAFAYETVPLAYETVATASEIVAIASEIGPGFSPDIQTPPKLGLQPPGQEAGEGTLRHDKQRRYWLLQTDGGAEWHVKNPIHRGEAAMNGAPVSGRGFGGLEG